MKGRILLGVLMLALQPVGLFAQATTATIKLSWTDAINPVGTVYNVRRGNSATACTSAAVTTDTCTLLNPAPLTVLTFTDTPSVGGVYTYNVKAVNSVGIESVSSNFATASLSQPSPVVLSCQVALAGSTVTVVCK